MAKKGGAGKGKTRDSLVVGAKVREYIKSKGFRTGGDLLESLSEKVYCCIDCASTRTKANGRQTVESRDI